jgi:ApaG protein
MSDTTTRGIRVLAESRYEPHRSAPAERQFFFSYRILIENTSDETAQLVSRRWVITDDTGRVSEVEGPGVVCETPVLAPGESFEYTSFCPLGTPVGTMEGHYLFEVAGSGERFRARIDPFTLAVPGALN